MPINRHFLKSGQGIAKILRLVCSLLAFCCFLFASRSGMYIGVAGLEFLFTLCFILLYVTNLDKKITFFFWTLIDLLNALLAAMSFFIVSLLAIINMMNQATIIGGGFGMAVVALCYVEMFFLGRLIKYKRPTSVQSQPARSK
ncbi:chemokine-like factor isoform X2 [Rhinatrema bivittatum]|uniref:chemokine-like factor isoform X2 n=1 Tax=Rhinatrema bivittatum TaxID=194408 RepID=UPI00112A8597|nr:chemokine-like factor isoform X2 [Rhinatrema bivittatum]